jgi:hypothetical protein
MHGIWSKNTFNIQNVTTKVYNIDTSKPYVPLNIIIIITIITLMTHYHYYHYFHYTFITLSIHFFYFFFRVLKK